jgi:hypothetical protein
MHEGNMNGWGMKDGWKMDGRKMDGWIEDGY